MIITTTSQLSKPVASGGRGYPSETHVRRGERIVHGDKELLEKLGRNDLCPCGSGLRFQEVLSAIWPFRWHQAEPLFSGLTCVLARRGRRRAFGLASISPLSPKGLAA